MEFISQFFFKMHESTNTLFLDSSVCDLNFQVFIYKKNFVIFFKFIKFLCTKLYILLYIKNKNKNKNYCIKITTNMFL